MPRYFGILDVDGKLVESNKHNVVMLYHTLADAWDDCNEMNGETIVEIELRILDPKGTTK